VIRLLHRVAPIVAIVLLAWTAYDLANPQCCLQDQKVGPSASSLAAVGSPQSSQPAVDDCFCCARCIDTGTRIPEIRTAPAWVDFAEPVLRLTTRSSSLDHPPQLT
jgi:hypothetical protein